MRVCFCDLFGPTHEHHGAEPSENDSHAAAHHHEHPAEKPVDDGAVARESDPSCLCVVLHTPNRPLTSTPPNGPEIPALAVQPLVRLVPLPTPIVQLFARRAVARSHSPPWDRSILPLRI